STSIVIAGIAGAMAWVLALPVGSTSIVIAGIAGAMADSLLGATAQRRQWCASCQRVTEMRVHDCGTETTRIGGISWIENDMVNLLATIVGSLIAFTLATTGLKL
ncbi:MAG TPA: DUF92 domain-containing protein, partial [Gemmatimonadaceae bacterium]